MPSISSHWPPFRQETRQTTDIDSRGQTVVGDATHSVPNYIADLSIPRLSNDTEELAKAAEASMPRRDTAIGGVMEGLLLRTEAMDSSRIEGIRTNVRNLLMAAAGAPSKEGAKLTYKNFSALASILESPKRPVVRETICEDHATIMEDESFAGQLRESEDDIVYIRGETIFKAEYVPPLPHHIPDLISDLALFARRTDIPIVKKAAITHSQFECIHPFLDGNGRTGRALTQRLLLLSGFRTLPVSAAYFGMLNEYFETFRRYQEGDLNHAVKIHAIAIIAATKAIITHTGDREVLLDKWEAATEAHRPARENMRKALSWISGTPAFTEEALAQAIKISERTVKRITSELAEAEILTKTSRTAPSEDIGLRKQIWEAREMYDIAERVEATTKNVAARMVKEVSDPPGGFTGPPSDPGPPSNPGPPSVPGGFSDSPESPNPSSLTSPSISPTPRPSPSISPSDRKQQLADMIADTGAHPIACLPTLGDYDYAISPWELFVFRSEDLRCRRQLEQTAFCFSGDDYEKMHLYMQSPPYSEAYGPTPYNTVVPKRSEDTTSRNFADVAESINRQLFPSLRKAWQQTLDAFQDVVRAQHMWQQIGVGERYPGPHVVSPPYTPPHQEFVGEAVAHALFIGLETFFAEENDFIKKRLSKDAPEDYHFGYPASLHVLCKRLEISSSTALDSQYYDAEFGFSQEQKDAIHTIRKDLGEYRRSTFWDDIRKAKENSERWESERKEIIESMISNTKKYPTKQLMIDYLKACRNPRAHNSTSPREEDYFIQQIGYFRNTSGQESMTKEAIDVIFTFISRINTEVFGLQDDLTAWRSSIEATAIEEAQTLQSVFINHEIAKAERAGLLRNETFRNAHSEDLQEHKCKTYSSFHMLEEASKFFRRRCEDCGNNMRILRLERPDFDLEIQGPDGTIIPIENCEAIIIAEGAYGYTNVTIQCEDSDKVVNGAKVIETRQLPSSVTLTLTTESHTWQQECTVDTPTPKKNPSLRTKNPYAMPSFAHSLSSYDPMG